MNFHVYIEQELESKLELLCKKTGSKRNSLVREALREYLKNHLSQQWPESVFDFKPDRHLPRFESLRGDLPPDRDNIFTRKK